MALMFCSMYIVYLLSKNVSECKRFDNDEARVLVYCVDSKFEKLPTLADGNGGSRRRCAHIILDLGLGLRRFSKLSSLVHGCGRRKDSLYYLVASDVPGDLISIKQFAKYFSDRGATVVMDELNPVDTISDFHVRPGQNYAKFASDDFFSERAVDGLNKVAGKYFRQDVKFAPWHTLVWPRDMPSTGVAELTEHSVNAITTMLKNLRYLPLELERDIMSKLEEELFMTHLHEDIRGSFRREYKL